MSNSGKPVSFSFDLTAQSLTAIKKAAYKFSGSYVIDISTNDNRCTVVATPIEGAAHRWGIEMFPNEVLDQDLREIVAGETNVLRDVILAQAFSAVSLLNADFESSDFEGDPLGVSKQERKLGE
jgi:His-Xaa-Ser system protein HxsD